MMYKSLSILLCVITLSCTEKVVENDDSKSTIIELQNYQPKMLAPGIISKAPFEGHASITPDGKEVYFAIYSNDHRYSTIAYSKNKNNDWTEPKIVSFSGKYSDGSPALSPDGQLLYFSSRRPVDGTEINSSNDLWVVKRKSSGEWGKPKWLNDKINTPFNEFSPSVDNKGSLYFCSNRTGGFGEMDVYYAEFINGEFKTPILLGDSINSKYHEGNVGVSPDGKTLFVMVQHKPGDYGYDDIHYSIMKNGSWSALKNIGRIINTYTYDFSPKVSPDGKILYFSSRISNDFNTHKKTYTFESFQEILNSPLNGFGNIYFIEIEKLNIN